MPYGLITKLNNPDFWRLLSGLRGTGIRPVLIVSGQAEKLSLPEARVKVLLRRHPALDIVRVKDLSNVRLATKKILRALKRAGIQSPAGWLNMADSYTAAYLETMHKLEIEGPAVGYANARQKHYCRLLTNGPKKQHIPFLLFAPHYRRSRISKFGCEKAINPVEDNLLASEFDLIVSELKKDGDLPVDAIYVKPVLGAGSADVFRVNNCREWNRLSTRICRAYKGREPILDRFGVDLVRDFLVEAEIPGIETEIDGFVDADRVIICAIGFKHQWLYQGNSPRELGGILYCPNVFKTPIISLREVKHWLKGVTDSIGFRRGVFHVEAKVDKRCIRLIEFNPRIGGGKTAEIVRRVSGLDLMAVAGRLWFGVKANKQKIEGKADRLFYLILQPTRPRQRVEAILPNKSHKSCVYLRELCRLYQASGARWFPLVNKRYSVDSFSKEHYLGELHLYNPRRISVQNLNVVCEELTKCILGDQRLIKLKRLRLRRDKKNISQKNGENPPGGITRKRGCGKRGG